MIAKDLGWDTIKGDIIIKDGDFVITQSDNTHVYDILYSYIGHWKNATLMCVGTYSYVNGKNANQILASDIKRQLITDGYRINYLNVENINRMMIDYSRIK